MEGLSPRTPCIVSAVRTPLGAFQGALSSFSATELGAIAIKAAVERSGVNTGDVEEVIMGNVLSANLGQAPATQAALGAGLPPSVPCTAVNKVCASGLKAVMLAAQAILTGSANVVVAGGMESMSNTPHYLPASRRGTRLGDMSLVDGMIKDGLWDAHHHIHMGSCAEMCAERYAIGRQQQDEHALNSHTKARAAAAAGHTCWEVVPVPIGGGSMGGSGAGNKPRTRSPPRNAGTATYGSTAGGGSGGSGGPDPSSGSGLWWEDEALAKMDPGKLKALGPAFKKDGGCVTAGNSSPLTDGAAALVLASWETVQRKGLPLLAVVRGAADAAQEPEWFTTAPSLAVPKALKAAGGLSVQDVDAWEVNEAFSVVDLANAKLLGLPTNKVNMHGGAVALGHPIGASGARILVTLLNVLRLQGGRYGCAAICNGGGGASALIIEVPKQQGSPGSGPHGRL